MSSVAGIICFVIILFVFKSTISKTKTAVEASVEHLGYTARKATHMVAVNAAEADHEATATAKAKYGVAKDKDLLEWFDENQ